MLNEGIFEAAGRRIATHPFLEQAANGRLPDAAWGRYFEARLQAGPGFVTFLQTLKEQAIAAGQQKIADAVSKNLDEELGVLDGRVHAERSHAEWRTWFRAGIQRVLAERGVQMREEPAPDFIEVHEYPKTFGALNERGDVFESMGALGVLEIGLGREYERVIEGLQRMLPPDALSAKEWTYLRSHAIHDARHFEEVFEPLARACDTPEKAQSVLMGVVRAQMTKLRFLDGANRQPQAA